MLVLGSSSGQQGLQVGIRFVAGFLSCKLSPHCKAKLVWRQCHRPEHQSDCLCLSLQYSMWELQKRPEYKQKIEKPALERDLQRRHGSQAEDAVECAHKVLRHLTGHWKPLSRDDRSSVLHACNAILSTSLQRY